jgi:hypothetical protein
VPDVQNPTVLVMLIPQPLMVCRLFSVPAAAYPWALLVFWQLVMPGASFLGHLCGVLVRCRNMSWKAWIHSRETP